MCNDVSMKTNRTRGLYRASSGGIRVRCGPLFRLRLINIAGVIGVSCLHCVSETGKV